MVDLLLDQPRIQPDLPDMGTARSQSGRYLSQTSQTPLVHAVIQWHGKIVERLVGLDVELNWRDELGQTPLYHAVSAGNIPLVRLLLATPGVDPNARADYGAGRAPLHLAAEKGNLAIVELLLAVEDTDIDVKDRCWSTPLFYASHHGRDGIVKLLLERGCAPNPLDQRRLRTPSKDISRTKESSNRISLSNSTYITVKKCDVAYHTFSLS
jgi:ankyrin repeat protein